MTYLLGQRPRSLRLQDLGTADPDVEDVSKFSRRRGMVSAGKLFLDYLLVPQRTSDDKSKFLARAWFPPRTIPEELLGSLRRLAIGAEAVEDGDE